MCAGPPGQHRQQLVARGAAAVEYLADVPDQPHADRQQRVVRRVGDIARTGEHAGGGSGLTGLDGEIGLHGERVSELDRQRRILLRCSVFKSGDRVQDMVVGGRAIADVPLVDGQRVVVGADGHRRAEALADPHGAVARHDRVVETVGEVVLAGRQLQQLGLQRVRQQTTMRQRDLEEFRGLGVGAGASGRTAGGSGRRRRQRVVAGPDRVVGEYRGVRVRRRLVGTDEPAVQAGLGTGRDHGADRASAQVVAERHPAGVAPDQPGVVKGT